MLRNEIFYIQNQWGFTPTGVKNVNTFHEQFKITKQLSIIFRVNGAICNQSPKQSVQNYDFVQIRLSLSNFDINYETITRQKRMSGMCTMLDKALIFALPP